MSEISAPPVPTTTPEATMTQAEIAEAAAAPAQIPTPAPEPKPAVVAPPQPVVQAPDNNAAAYDAMREQITQLKAQLQESNIKSTLAERRLIPQDNALVVRMITEKIDAGMDADKACAELYKTHPYLFKPPVVTKTGPSEAEVAQNKSLNDAYVKGVIGRLRRDAITIGG